MDGTELLITQNDCASFTVLHKPDEKKKFSRVPEYAGTREISKSGGNIPPPSPWGKVNRWRDDARETRRIPHQSIDFGQSQNSNLVILDDV